MNTFLPLCSILNLLPQNLTFEDENETLQYKNLSLISYDHCFYNLNFLILPSIPLFLLIFSLPLVIWSLEKFHSKSYFLNGHNAPQCNPKNTNANGNKKEEGSTTTRDQSILYMIKLTTNSGVLFLWLSLFALNIFDYFTSQLSDPYQIFAPLLYCLSYLISIYIEWYVRKTDQRRTPILFLFYLISTVGAVMQLMITLRVRFTPPYDSNNTKYGTSSAIAYNTTNLILNFVLLVTNTVSESYKNNKIKVCPEMYVSWPNCLVYQWFTPLINKGYKRTLQEDDLWQLNSNDTGHNVANKLEENWREQLSLAKNKTGRGQGQGQEPSLVKAIIKTFGTAFLSAALFELLTDILLFTQPLILKLMIEFVKTKEMPNSVGYTYAILMYWEMRDFSDFFLIFSDFSKSTSFESLFN